MKENTIHFDSYFLHDLIAYGKEDIAGHFTSSLSGVSTKAIINVRLTESDAVCSIPWKQRVILSSRFVNRPFRIAHPAMKSYCFVVSGFSLSETPKSIKVPLLYNMLYKIGLKA